MESPELDSYSMLEDSESVKCFDWSKGSCGGNAAAPEATTLRDCHSSTQPSTTPTPTTPSSLLNSSEWSHPLPLPNAHRLSLHTMFAVNAGLCYVSHEDLHSFWQDGNEGRKIIGYFASLPPTPELAEAHAADEDAYLRCPEDRFIDSNNKELFDCALRHIKSKPREFGVNELKEILLGAFFPTDHEEINFRLGPKGLDYLIDFERNRSNALYRAACALGAENEWDYSPDGDVIKWRDAVRYQEPTIVKLLARIHINLRNWTMVKMLQQNEFDKIELLAMLNTLYPPNSSEQLSESDDPTLLIGHQSLMGHRTTFFRLILQVEAEPMPRKLNAVAEYLNRMDSVEFHHWSSVRDALEMYLDISGIEINDANRIIRRGIDAFSRTSAGVSYMGLFGWCESVPSPGPKADRTLLPNNDEALSIKTTKSSIEGSLKVVSKQPSRIPRPPPPRTLPQSLPKAPLQSLPQAPSQLPSRKIRPPSQAMGSSSKVDSQNELFSLKLTPTRSPDSPRMRGYLLSHQSAVNQTHTNDTQERPENSYFELGNSHYPRIPKEADARLAMRSNSRPRAVSQHNQKVWKQTYSSRGTVPRTSLSGARSVQTPSVQETNTPEHEPEPPTVPKKSSLRKRLSLTSLKKVENSAPPPVPPRSPLKNPPEEIVECYTTPSAPRYLYDKKRISVISEHTEPPTPTPKKYNPYKPLEKSKLSYQNLNEESYFDPFPTSQAQPTVPDPVNHYAHSQQDSVREVPDTSDGSRKDRKDSVPIVSDAVDCGTNIECQRDSHGTLESVIHGGHREYDPVRTSESRGRQSYASSDRQTSVTEHSQTRKPKKLQKTNVGGMQRLPTFFGNPSSPVISSPFDTTEPLPPPPKVFAKLNQSTPELRHYPERTSNENGSRSSSRSSSRSRLRNLLRRSRESSSGPNADSSHANAGHQNEKQEKTPRSRAPSKLSQCETVPEPVPDKPTRTVRGRTSMVSLQKAFRGRLVRKSKSAAALQPDRTEEAQAEEPPPLPENAVDLRTRALRDNKSSRSKYGMKISSTESSRSRYGLKLWHKDAGKESDVHVRPSKLPYLSKTEVPHTDSFPLENDADAKEIDASLISEQIKDASIEDSHVRERQINNASSQNSLSASSLRPDMTLAAQTKNSPDASGLQTRTRPQMVANALIYSSGTRPIRRLVARKNRRKEAKKEQLQGEVDVRDLEDTTMTLAADTTIADSTMVDPTSVDISMAEPLTSDAPIPDTPIPNMDILDPTAGDISLVQDPTLTAETPTSEAPILKRPSTPDRSIMETPPADTPLVNRSLADEKASPIQDMNHLHTESTPEVISSNRNVTPSPAFSIKSFRLRRPSTPAPPPCLDVKLLKETVDLSELYNNKWENKIFWTVEDKLRAPDQPKLGQNIAGKNGKLFLANVLRSRNPALLESVAAPSRESILRDLEAKSVCQEPVPVKLPVSAVIKSEPTFVSPSGDDSSDSAQRSVIVSDSDSSVDDKDNKDLDELKALVRKKGYQMEGYLDGEWPPEPQFPKEPVKRITEAIIRRTLTNIKLLEIAEGKKRAQVVFFNNEPIDPELYKIPDKPYLNNARPEHHQMEYTRQWHIAAQVAERKHWPPPPGKPSPFMTLVEGPLFEGTPVIDENIDPLVPYPTPYLAGCPGLFGGSAYSLRAGEPVGTSIDSPQEPSGDGKSPPELHPRPGTAMSNSSVKTTRSFGPPGFSFTRRTIGESLKREPQPAELLDADGSAIFRKENRVGVPAPLSLQFKKHKDNEPPELQLKKVEQLPTPLPYWKRGPNDELLVPPPVPPIPWSKRLLFRPKERKPSRHFAFHGHDLLEDAKEYLEEKKENISTAIHIVKAGLTSSEDSLNQAVNAIMTGMHSRNNSVEKAEPPPSPPADESYSKDEEMSPASINKIMAVLHSRHSSTETVKRRPPLPVEWKVTDEETSPRSFLETENKENEAIPNHIEILSPNRSSKIIEMVEDNIHSSSFSPQAPTQATRPSKHDDPSIEPKAIEDRMVQETEINREVSSVTSAREASPKRGPIVFEEPEEDDIYSSSFPLRVKKHIPQPDEQAVAPTPDQPSTPSVDIAPEPIQPSKKSLIPSNNVRRPKLDKTTVGVGEHKPVLDTCPTVAAAKNSAGNSVKGSRIVMPARESLGANAMSFADWQNEELKGKVRFSQNVRRGSGQSFASRTSSGRSRMPSNPISRNSQSEEEATVSKICRDSRPPVSSNAFTRSRMNSRYPSQPLDTPSFTQRPADSRPPLQPLPADSVNNARADHPLHVRSGTTASLSNVRQTYRSTPRLSRGASNAQRRSNDPSHLQSPARTTMTQGGPNNPPTLQSSNRTLNIESRVNNPSIRPSSNRGSYNQGISSRPRPQLLSRGLNNQGGMSTPAVPRSSIPTRANRLAYGQRPGRLTRTDGLPAEEVVARRAGPSPSDNLPTSSERAREHQQLAAQRVADYMKREEEKSGRK